MFKVNLQHFAGEDEEIQSLYTEDEVVEETHEEETSSDEETTEEGTAEETKEKTEEGTSEEETEEDTEEKDEKNTDDKFNDSVPWVKKRLARARRAFEKEFISEVVSASEGVAVSKEEIPSAVRLWNLLKHNEGLNSEVTKVIDNAFRNKSVKTLREISGSTKDTERELQLEIENAQLSLKSSDPIYRKYEAEILEWAEDEGMSIEKAADVKRAYQAWKGENVQKLMSQAEAVGARKAQTNTASKQAAKVQSHRNNIVSKPKPIDYRNASDLEILKHEKMSLFVED